MNLHLRVSPLFHEALNHSDGRSEPRASAAFGATYGNRRANALALRERWQDADDLMSLELSESPIPMGQLVRCC